MLDTSDVTPAHQSILPETPAERGRDEYQKVMSRRCIQFFPHHSQTLFYVPFYPKQSYQR